MQKKDIIEDSVNKLHNSQAWLDLVLATLQEGVITLTKDLKISFANDAIASMLNIDRSALLESSVWEILPLYHNGKKVKKKDYVDAVSRNKVQSLSGVYTLQTLDKSFIVDVTCSNIPKIHQIVVVVHDISKLKQETAYVRLHQKIAAAANESISIEQSMQKSLDLICEDQGWQIGHIYFLHKNDITEMVSTKIWYVESRNKFREFIKTTEATNFKKGKGMPGLVLARKKPIWISDIDNNKSFLRAKYASKIGIKTAAAFPVFVQKEVVAVIEIFSTSLIQPDNQLLEVMVNIGTQLGRVIERNRAEEARIALTRESEARKQAEAIEEKLLYHASLLQSISDAVISTDMEYKIHSWNEGAEKLYGWKAEEVIGKPAPKIIPTDYAKSNREDFNKTIIKNGYWKGEVIQKRRDKTAVNIFASVSLIKDAKGKSIGTVAVNRDITDRVRLQENLAYLAEASKILSSSLDFKTTLSNIAKLAVPRIADWCAIEILDRDGQLEQVAVAHKDPKKVKWAKELRKADPPTLDSPTGVPKVIRTGKSEFYPFIPDELLVKIAKDKKHLKLLRDLGFVSAMVAPLYQGNKCIGGITFVTSETKRQYTKSDLAMAEELAARASTALENAGLYKASQDAVMLRDNFISVASHELKTPVTSVKIFTQVLQKHSEQIGDEKAINHLSKMDKQLNKLIELIYDLLNVSKIQAGRMEFSQRLYDFDASVEEIIDVLQQGATKHKIVINGVTNKKIYADEERISQVISNLISNAIKYSPQSDKVLIHLSANKDNVIVCVEDFGIGLAKEHAQKIFERFYRVFDTTDKTFPGLGIGLYISSEIIKRHHGKLWTESKTGKGSKFYFSLPINKRKKPNGVQVL